MLHWIVRGQAAPVDGDPSHDLSNAFGGADRGSSGACHVGHHDKHRRLQIAIAAMER